MPVQVEIVLSDTEKAELQTEVSCQMTLVRLITRAKAILLAGESVPSYQIAQQPGVSRPTVNQWRKRYRDNRLAGIVKDRPCGANHGEKKTADQQKLRRKIIRITTQEKTEGQTHWSTRTIGKAAGMTHSFVNSVWQEAGLKLHLVKHVKASNDPHFEEKLVDVVGLYMNPPEQAVVFCVDEKSSIQALDRTQPGLPLKKGRGETMTHDDKRHGRSTLFAALNAATGEVLGECKPKDRHQAFLAFIQTIEKQTPKELDIHIIVDNNATHKHEKIRRWLKRNKRVTLHFIPTNSSWLNLVDRFFGLLTDKALKRGVFTSVEELEASIQEFIDAQINQLNHLLGQNQPRLI